MAEEPDDEEGREPSDSSANGSDEERTESEVESEVEPELTEPEGPGPHDNDPTDEGDAAEDGDTTDDTDESAAADADETDSEDADGQPETDGDDEAPEFTNVQGLGADGVDVDESTGDVIDAERAADGESDDGEYMFEDYDPDEPPEAPEDRGATPPSGGIDQQEAERTTTVEDDEGLLGGGPDSDEEMPLAAHIEEMMKRLSVVFIVGGAVALTLLGLGQLFEQVPTAVDIIDALWNNAIPGAPEIEGRRPRVYGPLELVLTKLKVTALAGLLVALPVFVYETYMFMRPGLYPKERRYYISAIPTSLILGTVGMAFSHFIVIPAIMQYFTVYTQENVATVAYGLSSTFSLIIVLMSYMAVIFQIPLFIMLAIMMGLVTRRWLEDKRLLFWGAFLTIAFLVNPDPTGMTPFIIAATMIVLFEGTLALLRWTGN
jgi:sec-independent protein translocase protein TatC